MNLSNQRLLESVVMVCVLQFAACASTGVTENANHNAVSGTTLLVRNANPHDINIYLLKGSSRFRLGTVPALAASEFRIPPGLILATGSVALSAHAIGTNTTYSFPEIVVSPGERVIVDLQNVLEMSAFAVMRR